MNSAVPMEKDCSFNAGGKIRVWRAGGAGFLMHARPAAHPACSAQPQPAGGEGQGTAPAECHAARWLLLGVVYCTTPPHAYSRPPLLLLSPRCPANWQRKGGQLSVFSAVFLSWRSRALAGRRDCST